MTLLTSQAPDFHPPGETGKIMAREFIMLLIRIVFLFQRGEAFALDIFSLTGAVALRKAWLPAFQAGRLGRCPVPGGPSP
jgi:hypothetical protein